MIRETQELKAFCKTLEGLPYITVDTEFLRDKTYYPRLCLIQVAGPGVDPVAIDPMEDGLKLDSFLKVLEDESIIKVFHAARQDIDIFFKITGKVPSPLFDTQVAAMVCGYGDQIGYNNLVQGICNKRLDKGPQFTDWSRRPLSKRQLSYALDDVTYLRDVYEHLEAELKRRGRLNWVKQEMNILTNPDTYNVNPMDCWKRIKVRTNKPRVLAVLRELAAWRELEAQKHDVPKNRILRDDSLVDMAVHMPENTQGLSNIKNVSDKQANGPMGQNLLKAIKRGIKSDDLPEIQRRQKPKEDITAILEMLKMLLRIECSVHDVAPKLVANSKDLEALALDDSADIPALRGWRLEVFGKDALALKHGKIALSIENNEIVKKPV